MLVEAKKPFFEACILRFSEKSHNPNSNHNRQYVEFPSMQWFNELQIGSQKDLDDIQLAKVSNNCWSYCFEMKNGSKTREMANLSLYSFHGTSVGKVQICYSNVAFHTHGLRFFNDKGGCTSIGDHIVDQEYKVKEIVLAANERIVGVAFLEPYSHELQFMIARLK